MTELTPVTPATEEETPKDKVFGPRIITNYHVITRTIAGIFGGMCGTIVLIVILLLGSNIFSTINSATSTATGAAALLGNKTEINIFLVIAGVTFASLTANIMSLLGFVLFDREKYSKFVISTIQIIIMTLVTLGCMLPSYLLVGSSYSEQLVYLVTSHLVISSLLSAFVVEIVNNYKYVMVGFYGITLGILIGVSVELFLAMSPKTGNTIGVLGFLILTLLPLIWTSIGFFSSLFEMLYGWLYTVYGLDWLGNMTNYIEIEEDEDESSLDDEENKDEDTNMY